MGIYLGVVKKTTGAAAGSEDAVIGDIRTQVDALYRRHGRRVGSYLLARTGDFELAEALTANVFVTVVRKLHQCQGNQVAWLWTIVRHELARHFREHRRHDSLDTAEEEELTADDASPLENLVDGERLEQLRHALASLSDQQQAIVFMKFFEDMPNAEIAAATGLSPGNVGVRVHRTLKQLRMLLESECKRV